MKEHSIRNQCPGCGWTPSINENENHQDHCPNCLCSLHQETAEGLMCGGIMEPVSVWVRDDDQWEIIQRCRLCGEMQAVKMTEQDSRIKVLSVISKPLALPPFPIEHMEKRTRIMGGQGELGNERRRES